VNKALADDKAPWTKVTEPADPLSSAEDADNPDGIEPDSGTVFGATFADLGYRFAKVRACTGSWRARVASSFTAAISVPLVTCSAQARRPFFRHAKHRLDDCLEILDSFKMIAIL
jgi:hypothetical protein